MNQRANAVRVALSILVSVSAAACAVSTEEQADSHSQALARGPVDPTDPIDRRPPPPPPPPAAQFPPANPTYCPTVEPTCSVQPLGWNDPRSVELQHLGCSGEQHWFTGTSSGLLGGIFALCPNTAAVRAEYGQFYSAAVNTCSACIPQAPAGEIYVLLEGFVGPNCESGCLTNPTKQVGQVGQVDTGDSLGL